MKINSLLFLFLILSAGCKKTDLTANCKITKVDFTDSKGTRAFFFTYDKDNKLTSASWSPYDDGLTSIFNIEKSSKEDFNINLYSKNSDGYITASNSNSNSDWMYTYDKDGYLISANRISESDYLGVPGVKQINSSVFTYSWLDGNIKEMTAKYKTSIIASGTEQVMSSNERLVEYLYNDKPNQTIVPLDMFLGKPPKNQITKKTVYEVTAAGKKVDEAKNSIFEYNADGCVTKWQVFKDGNIKETLYITY